MFRSAARPKKRIAPRIDAYEKHVPVIKVNGREVVVTVGAVEHPMVDAHYIEWIILETKQGRQRKTLKPGEKQLSLNLPDVLLLARFSSANALELMNAHRKPRWKGRRLRHHKHQGQQGQETSHRCVAAHLRAV